MIKRSPMTFVNAGGCLLLVVLCVIQWREIANWQDQHTRALQDLRREEAQRRESQNRQAALEGDVAMLKNSLQRMEEKLTQTEASWVSAQRRADEAQRSLELEGKSHAAQIEKWQQAIEQRDQLQAALQKQLQEARRRLDEAIAAMKKSAQAP